MMRSPIMAHSYGTDQTGNRTEIQSKWTFTGTEGILGAKKCELLILQDLRALGIPEYLDTNVEECYPERNDFGNTADAKANSKKPARRLIAKR